MIDIKKRITVLALTAMLLLSGCAKNNASSGVTVIDGSKYTTATGSDNSSQNSTDTGITITSEATDGSTEKSEEVTSASDEANVTTSTNTEAATQGSTVTTVPTDSTTSTEKAPDNVTTVTSATTERQTSAETTEATVTTTVPPETTTQTPTETTATEAPPSGSYPANSYQALNYSEVKGVWLSYLELNTMLKGKTEAQFRANISEAFDNASALGLNTVYVHVRAFSDAFYKSKLFPWSQYVTGTLGATPDFDPLEIMLEEAHSRNLSFQAWINPLRGCTTANIGEYSSSYSLKRWYNSTAESGKYVVAVGNYYFLNPAYDDIITLISDGAAEIVSNYNVDGIHIDDYFYPTTDASFDSAAYNASGYSTLSSFRFANCDKLVKGLYDAVKSVNSTALFGVSCQGSIENNYNNMYADVKKWCGTRGYTDYIAPQIYYGFNNSAQPYETCVSRWQELVKDSKIPLIVGLSVYKIGISDEWAGAGKTEWQTDTEILKRQLDYARGMSDYGGVILYCYNSIFAPSSDVKANVDKEIKAFKNAL